ncbi:MAG TPA: hypothetical protein VGL71_02080 [Urbifossiella sp.]|jgi:hypothetical protein
MQIFFVFISFQAIGLGADHRSQFIADYSPHAERLRDRYTGWDIKYKQTSPAVNDSELEQIHAARYGHAFYILTSESRKLIDTKTRAIKKELPAKYIGGLNQFYAFEISREPTGLVLRQVYLIADPQVDPNYISYVPCSFPYANGFLRKSYLEIAQGDSIKITGYETLAENFRELSTERTFTNRNTQESAIVIEKYLFDANRGWMCTRERAQTPGVSSFNETLYHYADKPESLPMIKSWESWQRDGKDGGTDRLIARFEILESQRADVREEECRLSAFGLPEPVGVNWKKESRTYPWFLAAAGVFLVLAVVFRHLARRKMAKSPS